MFRDKKHLDLRNDKIDLYFDIVIENNESRVEYAAKIEIATEDVSTSESSVSKGTILKREMPLALSKLKREAIF